MTTDILIFQMRSRLTDVERQIDKCHEIIRIASQMQALYATASLSMLTNERLWLTGMIDRIEQEGVQP